MFGGDRRIQTRGQSGVGFDVPRCGCCPASLAAVVMDNLSAHWTPAIRRWAVSNNVGLLPTPTNASHLDRIECHVWAFAEFVIKGSDDADWTEFTKAAQAYIRRRNRDHHDPRIIELEHRRKVA